MNNIYYSTIVTVLDSIYEETYEAKALGISKILEKKSTLLSTFLRDFTLCQVAKFNKTLQVVQAKLSMISSLVDSTLHSLDDWLLRAANWVLELLDVSGSLDEEAGIKVPSADMKSF